MPYNINFDLDNKDYLLMPYINYTTPMSLCLFALGQQPTAVRDNRITILGQRFLAKFSLMVIYDREIDAGFMAVGGGHSGALVQGDFLYQILISTCIIMLLIILLIFLIIRKRRRVTAEAWLEHYKNILFVNEWGRTAEVDILEALVEHKRFLAQAKHEREQREERKSGEAQTSAKPAAEFPTKRAQSAI